MPFVLLVLISLPLATSTEFDYIVVGGGVAGSLAAARLATSGSQQQTVLLLEAGPPAHWVNGGRTRAAGWASKGYGSVDLTQFDVPGEYANIAWKQDTYKVAQSGFTWQAKLLGGGGVVNGALTMDPSAADLARLPDGWAAALRSQFDTLRRELNLTTTPSTDGIQYASATRQMLARGLEALGFSAAELNSNPDARDRTHCLPVVTALDGVRQSTASVHLVRALAAAAAASPPGGADRLTVRTGAEVGRLLMQAGTARGVKYRTAGGGSEVAWLRAGGRLVLAAGALSTPRLLMLSGIGPPAQLLGLASAGLLAREAECATCDDISVEASWRASEHVGGSLSDHTLARFVLRAPSFSHAYGADDDTFDAAAHATAHLASYFGNGRTGPYAQFGPTG